MLEPAEEDDYIPADNASTWELLRHSMIWKDTVSSGSRFFISLCLLVPAVILALHIGLFPWFGAGFLRFVLFFDKIIALSLLPILFIVFGIEEWSKIALIVIGVAPTMILDVTQMVKAVPAGAGGQGLHPRRQQLRRRLSRRLPARSSRRSSTACASTSSR